LVVAAAVAVLGLVNVALVVEVEQVLTLKEVYL
jgi:hypothetical protein